MRLTLTVLGFDLDVSLGPSATADETCSLDGGTTASIGPISFVSTPGAVEDVPMPQRVPAWDEPDE